MNAAPLSTVSTFLEDGGGDYVTVVLDERMAGPSVKDAVPYEVLGLCSLLDTLLEKEILDTAVDPDTHVWSQNVVHENYIAQMASRLYAINKTTSLSDYLMENGLHELFPLVGSRVCGYRMQGDSKLDIADYYTQMALLNQIHAISTQLQGDVNLDTHKYFAHQIALLYQSINQAGQHFVPFKKRIEERFEEVKAVTEQKDNPLLSDDQKAWISQLTNEILAEVAAFPRGLVRRLEPMKAFVRQHPVKRRE